MTENNGGHDSAELSLFAAFENLGTREGEDGKRRGNVEESERRKEIRVVIPRSVYLYAAMS